MNFSNSLQSSVFTYFFKISRCNSSLSRCKSKGNYIPISILPNISKIFERGMFRQSYSFMESLLSRAQHIILSLSHDREMEISNR